MQRTSAKTRKYLLLTLVLLSAAFVEQARAFPPLLPIRAEIVNQQVLLSNTVPLNRPLATALRKAVAKIDTTNPTNRVTGASAFSSVASTLSKSSLSNAFGPLLDTALASFLGSIDGDADGASNRLAATFPSGPHTAAQKKLNLLFTQIASADANANIIAAARVMSQAARTFVVANSLVTKAENAPPPPSSVTGTIVANGRTTQYRSRAAPVIPGAPGFFVINSANGPSGIVLGLNQLSPGVNNLNVGNAGTSFSAIATRFLPRPPATGSAVNGTMQVTWDPAMQAIFGTFQFVADGNITVNNGEFFVTY